MDQRVENRNPWNPPGFRPSSTQLSSFRAVNFGGNSWHHRENRSTAFCVTSPARDIIFKERQGSWLTLRWLEISSIQLDLVNQVCGHIYRPNQPEIVLWPKPTERKDIVWEIFRGKDLANLRFSDSKKKKKRNPLLKHSDQFFALATSTGTKIRMKVVSKGAVCAFYLRYSFFSIVASFCHCRRLCAILIVGQGFLKLSYS